jgi:hypothetical protein
MLQTLAVSAIVAAAASWLAWRLVIPAGWQARVRARWGGPGSQPGCGCGRD